MFIVVLPQKATPHNILTDFTSYSRCRFMVECRDVSPLISTSLPLPGRSLSSPRCCAVPKLPSSSHRTRKEDVVEYIVRGRDKAGGQRGRTVCGVWPDEQRMVSAYCQR